MHKNSKRFLITLPNSVIKKLDEVSLGENPPEKIRNIIIAWLSEHGYLDKRRKK